MSEIEKAKALLNASGYVVLRARSYHQAQERQRIAEALKQAAEQDAKSSRDWAVDCRNEERRITDRLTFVYGVARAHGPTLEELRQPIEEAKV